MANYFANDLELGYSGNRYPQRPSRLIEDTLGFSVEELEGMENEVNQEIVRASIFLKLAAQGS